MWDKPLLAVMLVGSTLLAGVGAALGVLLLRWRSRHLSPAADHEQARVHPGISMHAIPIKGGIGLVFAIGYVVMFWFGAPGYRPIVLCAAALGGLVGVLLIWLRRRKTSDRVGISMLHLDGHTEVTSEQAHELERGPDNNALQLTSGPWQAGPARS
jgi:MFS family permease